MAYRQDLFSFTLNQLRSGKAQEELSEELNKVVNACRNTGKEGEINLKIKIRPDKGDTGQYFIEDRIDSKIPKMEKGKTLMWGTPEGNLQRTDPRQGELELRDVSQTVETKTVTEAVQTPKRIS